MENRKIFIGNLKFGTTEDELRPLLSTCGNVVNISIKRKQGFAIAEMSNADEAARAVQNLEGTMHNGREMRVSFEVKKKKAKSISVKRYNERKAAIFKERYETNNDDRQDGRKTGSSYKPAGNDRNDRNRGRSSGPSYGKQKDSYRTGNKAPGNFRNERSDFHGRSDRPAERGGFGYDSGRGRPDRGDSGYNAGRGRPDRGRSERSDSMPDSGRRYPERQGGRPSYQQRPESGYSGYDAGRGRPDRGNSDRGCSERSDLGYNAGRGNSDRGRFERGDSRQDSGRRYPDRQGGQPSYQQRHQREEGIRGGGRSRSNRPADRDE